MDEDRKIRFLVSPMVFIASFLWGLSLDPEKSVAQMIANTIALPDSWQGSLALLAAGGSGVFALGVAIGTITFVALRAWFCLFKITNGKSHEIMMAPEDREKAWTILGGIGPCDENKEVFIGVSLDHGVVQARYEGIHKWIRRRWNAFSIASTSITAIVLSLVVACFAGMTPSHKWYVPAGIMIAVFALSARWAWKDSMAMLSLMTKIDLSTNRKSPSTGGKMGAASDA